LEILNIIFNLKSFTDFREKWVQTSRGIYNFTALLSRFLNLRINFDFKTSFSKKHAFCNKKAHVLEILSIILNLKLFADFPRKMGSNIAGNIQFYCATEPFFLTSKHIFKCKIIQAVPKKIKFKNNAGVVLLHQYQLQ
jgi:hypothetical protein